MYQEILILNLSVLGIKKIWRCSEATYESVYLCLLQELTMRRTKNDMICFQITYNQTEYSLEVKSPSQIVFEVSQKHFNLFSFLFLF